MPSEANQLGTLDIISQFYHGKSMTQNSSGICPDMTEKLLTGTLNRDTCKTFGSVFSRNVYIFYH